MAKKYESSYAGYIHEVPVTHWSSEEKMKSKLLRVDLTDPNGIPAGGLPIISDGKIAYIDAGDSHTAIGAVSGMKKSICAYMPLIYTLGKARENMLISDPKAELYGRTAGYLAGQGYCIRCLDFRSLDRDCYNILERPARLYRDGERDKAQMMISDLVNVFAEKQRSGKCDVFWPDTASMYCNGAAAIMMESYPEIENINIKNLAEWTIYKNMDTFRDFVGEIHSRNTAMTNLRAVLTSAENTLRSILITASSFFSPFIQNDKLAKMLCHSTFSLEDFCKEKTALYIITDDTTTTCDAIVGIIISQIQSYLVDQAYRNGDGKLKTRVNFLLDEFTSFPIPGIDVALATHRSRQIRYYLCCQSISALKQRYDQRYEAILANCGNTMFLGTTEKEMLERISNQCGNTTLTPDGKEKPLISPAELMTLKKSWDNKEGIFLCLSESLRYCVNLPSIEAYDIGTHPLPVPTNVHPPVKSYTVFNLIQDIERGRAYIPFFYEDIDQLSEDKEGDPRKRRR